jgi:hypothetical protein
LSINDDDQIVGTDIEQQNAGRNEITTIGHCASRPSERRSTFKVRATGPTTVPLAFGLIAMRRMDSGFTVWLEMILLYAGRM